MARQYYPVVLAVSPVSATQDFLAFNCPHDGILREIHFWTTGAANTHGDNIFNLEVNTSALFSSAKPKIAQNAVHGSKVNLSNALAQGDIIIPQLESMATGGISANLVMLLIIDDPLEIGQNSQSADYTTVMDDSGKQIFHPSADTTPRTFTIDSNANVPYPVGAAITFINQNGAGDVTIAITSDTMRLAGAGTTGSRTLAANGIATAVKVGSTEWLIAGVGLT